MVQVCLVGSAEHEFWRRGRDGRADVDEIEFCIVTGHHPGTHMRALFVGHVTPGFVTRFAWFWDELSTPQFFSGTGIVRDDGACVRTTHGATAAP